MVVGMCARMIGTQLIHARTKHSGQFSFINFSRNSGRCEKVFMVLFHWNGRLFTTSYCYLIPMQWFLSTQPPNQTELKFHCFRHVIRMKPRECMLCFENKIEKHDAIVLDIVATCYICTLCTSTYINRMEKRVRCHIWWCTTLVQTWSSNQ